MSFNNQEDYDVDVSDLAYLPGVVDKDNLSRKAKNVQRRFHPDDVADAASSGKEPYSKRVDGATAFTRMMMPSLDRLNAENALSDYLLAYSGKNHYDGKGVPSELPKEKVDQLYKQEVLGYILKKFKDVAKDAGEKQQYELLNESDGYSEDERFWNEGEKFFPEFTPEKVKGLWSTALVEALNGVNEKTRDRLAEKVADDADVDVLMRSLKMANAMGLAGDEVSKLIDGVGRKVSTINAELKQNPKKVEQYLSFLKELADQNEHYRDHNSLQAQYARENEIHRPKYYLSEEESVYKQLGKEMQKLGYSENDISKLQKLGPGAVAHILSNIANLSPSELLQMRLATKNIMFPNSVPTQLKGK